MPLIRWKPGRDRLDKVYNQYIIEVPPAELPVSVTLVKEHLKISVTDTSQDAFLELLIKAATNYAQKFMNRILINTTFKTFRPCFTRFFSLRKAKATSVTSIQYLKDNVLTTVPSADYLLTQSNDYAQIHLVDGESWPTDVDNHPQAIEIVFVAGYGADSSFVPDDIKIALLNHIAKMYESRGDCDCTSSGSSANVAALLPPETRLVYEMCKIRSMIGLETCQ